MSKWISTAKQMPKAMYGESNCVLTISSLGTMRVLYFDGGNWCYPTGEALNTAHAYPITHWMLLPLPPEDEQPAAQGKWFYGGQKVINETFPVYICSSCKKAIPAEWKSKCNFCPNCGTDMREQLKGYSR